MISCSIAPPCQAFSISGKQEGFEDPRGTLFFDSLKVIQHNKPKVLVMENVKGLTQKKFEYEFETMLHLLDQEGYVNHWSIVNPTSFGFPHHRERVIIVSIRKDINYTYEFPEKNEVVKTLASIVQSSNEVDGKYYLSDMALARLDNINQRAEEKGLGYKSVVTSFDESETGAITEKNKQVFLNLDANFHKGADGKRTMFEVNGRLRMPTPIECFRLMGFDDTDCFKLVANEIKNTHLYKMAGNSIVVDMLVEILKPIIDLIKGGTNEVSESENVKRPNIYRTNL